MASFQALPAVLIQNIFSFLPNHNILCNTGGTCREFQAISLDDRFWAALCRRRWQIPPSQGYDKAGYKQFHLQEEHVTGRIRFLSGLRHRQGLLRDFEEISVVEGVAESLWKIFLDETESTNCRKIARILLRNLEFSSALTHLMNLWDRLLLLDGDEGTVAEDALVLEECVIAVNRPFSDIHGPVDTTCAWIQQQLDSLANVVQVRLPPGASAELKLNIMKQVFDENHFEMREPSENQPSNYLRWALANHVISRLNFIFIYKFVGRRIGLQVNILGNIIGETQNVETYVAMVPDAQAIVNMGESEEQFAEEFPIVSFRYLVQDAVPLPHHLSGGPRHLSTRHRRVWANILFIWTPIMRDIMYQSHDETIRCEECVENFLQVENIEDLW